MATLLTPRSFQGDPWVLKPGELDLYRATFNSLTNHQSHLSGKKKTKRKETNGWMEEEAATGGRATLPLTFWVYVQCSNAVCVFCCSVFIFSFPPFPFGAGAVAAPYFADSKLPKAQLSKIWRLVDQDRDSQISALEFAAAIVLIRNQLAGVAIPDSFPDALVESLRAVRTTTTTKLFPSSSSSSSLFFFFFCYYFLFY